MKKLLVLAGLIMVTAASCDSDNEVSNSKSKRIENYSLAYVGKTGEGVAAFTVCANKVENDVLYFETYYGNSYNYPLSDIKDEYIKAVKKNKVSLINISGTVEPVIFEANGEKFNSEISDIHYDNRRFGIRGILKNSRTETTILYRDYYQYLFFCGFTKVANKMMRDNEMFFTLEDFFEPEFSPPTGKGQFTAIYLPNKEFAMCQSYFENDEVVIRLCLFDGQATNTLKDGATYRYPIQLFTGVYANQARNNMASALFTPEGNLFPARLKYTGSWVYYDNMIHESFYYFDYRPRHEVEEMRDFLLSKGLGSIVTDRSFNGYFCMTPKE